MLLAVALVVALAVVALLVWAVSGGWDGLRPAAGADDRRVVDARQRAGAELDDLLARTQRSLGRGTVLATVRYDRCEQGQNNWKVHDGYTLRCELTEAVVQRPDAGEEVTPLARRVAAALTADGWTATGGGDEMTLPAQPNRSFLERTRAGSYHRDGQRHRLAVVVTTDADSPFVGPQPTGGSAVVGGDVTAYREALATPGLKVVAQTTVRYFEDG